MGRGQLAIVTILLLLSAATAFAQIGTITTFAGRPVPPAGLPLRAFGFVPNGIAPDSAGGVYFTMHGGIFYAGIDGKLAIIASSVNGTDPLGVFSDPGSLVLDSAGNLFVVASNRIWKISSTGIVTGIAGGTTQGFAGDGGPATSARFAGVGSLIVDSSGNLYLSDRGNQRVRRITAGGTITTIAGVGTAGFSGDDGPATAAQFNFPSGLAMDSLGNLYVSDWSNHRVRKISPGGLITTVVGTGGSTYNGDNIPASSATVTSPDGLTVDTRGNLYIVDFCRLRKVTPDGMITTFAGNGRLASYKGEGEPAASNPAVPRDVVVADTEGNIYFNETGFVRKITPDGILHSLVGNGYGTFSGDGGPASEAQINSPFNVAIDLFGNMYISDWGNQLLRKVTSAGTISSVAFMQAEALVADPTGAVYYTRSGQHGISKITADGTESAVAGSTYTSGFAGDGGSATSALFNRPVGLAMDSFGNLYVGDVNNRKIRKISSGVVTTLVSNVNPRQLDVDRWGNVYFASEETHSVYKVTPDGTLSRVAGSLVSGLSGDFGPATQARLFRPQAVVVDSEGNLYIADLANYRIRKVNTAGIITTIAGRGTSGYSGDGGNALAAAFEPHSIALDAAGSLYIVDRQNDVIRKVERAASPAVPFRVPQYGAASFQTTSRSTSVVTGAAQIQPDSESPVPSGLAILSYRRNGVLISEGSVPAVQPFRTGRLYAEIDGAVNTGVAFANTGTLPALVPFTLRNNTGLVRSGIAFVPPRGHLAAFLDQAPFNAPAGFRGVFSFNANAPVGVIALRGLLNERGDFLMTTLPVVDTSLPGSTSSFVLPHFADGGGWTSQLLLVNPGDSDLTGTLTFRDPQGNTLDSVNYFVPGGGQQRIATPGVSTSVRTGSVLVTPGAGLGTPSASVVFSYRSNNITVTEAGVLAVPESTAFQLFVENSGTLQTGLAIANRSDSPATVSLSFFDPAGAQVGATYLLSVPAQGQLAQFLREVPGVTTLLNSFRGLVSVTSDVPVSILGLRTRYNERGDFLITSLLPIDELAPAATEAVFPHFADGGGYSTEFVLFIRRSQQLGTGLMRMTLSSGQPIYVPMQ